ncbi:hypothetical protein Q3G72_024935 [Acer saccharum]|nr:hypothetical protein Q3G72_024935 [Acer saccharum]
MCRSSRRTSVHKDAPCIFHSNHTMRHESRCDKLSNTHDIEWNMYGHKFYLLPANGTPSKGKRRSPLQYEYASSEKSNAQTTFVFLAEDARCTLNHFHCINLLPLHQYYRIHLQILLHLFPLLSFPGELLLFSPILSAYLANAADS